ncbi:MAG: hypothetical protein PW734_01855 [Verrucomicrobium sp.]|nr:hypothetical protein [Verrucomicrobium sp.]
MAPSLFPSPHLAADPALAAFIRAIPKTETHLHLEGALPHALLRELDPSRFAAPPAFWEPGFRYDDFPHFDGVMREHAAAWFRSAEAYGRAAALLLPALAAQNVRYVEASVHLPAVHAAGGEAVLAALRAAAAATPQVELRLFAGMTRGLYATHAAVIEAALGWKEVDGFDVYGPEAVPFEPWTADVWRRARQAGKFTKAHAGEFGDAAAVRHAVEALGVTRVEHGLAAAADPALCALLRERGVTLDICPVSNWRLRAVPSLGAHPIAALHRAGVRCTVSTDDPFFFGTTLENEYAALAREAGLTRTELLQLARHGWEAALVSPAVREEALAEIAALQAGLG